MSLRSPSLYVASLDALAPAVAALPASDTEAGSRFAAPRRRAQSLGARALLREALRANAVSGDVDIVARDERPHVLHIPTLSVSLSHSGSLVACAMAATTCGVDVQRKVDKPLLEITEAFFSPEEHAELAPLEAAARADLFYAWWTLKEAWAKASGSDLLPALARVRVRVSERKASDRWLAWSFTAAPDIAGALVVQRPGDDTPPAALVWRGDQFAAADFACEPVTLEVRDA